MRTAGAWALRAARPAASPSCRRRRTRSLTAARLSGIDLIKPTIGGQGGSRPGVLMGGSGLPHYSPPTPLPWQDRAHRPWPAVVARVYTPTRPAHADWRARTLDDEEGEEEGNAMTAGPRRVARTGPSRHGTSCAPPPPSAHSAASRRAAASSTPRPHTCRANITPWDLVGCRGRQHHSAAQEVGLTHLPSASNVFCSRPSRFSLVLWSRKNML